MLPRFAVQIILIHSPFCWFQAHGLPVQKEFAETAETIQTHVARRFQLYYTTLEHVSLSAGPLLNDMLQLVDQILQNTEKAELGDQDVQVNVFSGHDGEQNRRLFCIL